MSKKKDKWMARFAELQSKMDTAYSHAVNMRNDFLAAREQSGRATRNEKAARRELLKHLTTKWK